MKDLKKNRKKTRFPPIKTNKILETHTNDQEKSKKKQDLDQAIDQEKSKVLLFSFINFHCCLGSSSFYCSSDCKFSPPFKVFLETSIDKT